MYSATGPGYPCADFEVAGTEMTRRAGIDDLPDLSVLLARAFTDNEVVRWMIPDDRLRRRILPRMYAVLLRKDYLRYGVVDVAHRGGRLAGAAIWYPPGAFPVPAARQLAQLPAFLRALGVHAFSLAPRFATVAELSQRHPRTPHWYFANMAVAPEHQRTGVSRALVEAGLRRSDADRLPVYGELTAPFYLRRLERFGFQTLDQVQVADVPPVRLVWRAPAQTSTTVGTIIGRRR
jgi:GNAT superfamily N-acetyltransferase